jgi:transcription initiation factor IIF auxiliary subunit
MTFAPKAEALRDAEGKIKFWQRTAKSREYYHVTTWLDGDPTELDRVRQVEYELHPSFRQRFRSSDNRENKFAITFWTWGLFNARMIIHLDDASEVELDYFLEYDLPADDGSNYIQVQPPT